MEYAGDTKSNPPVYQIKITLRNRPGNCIQALRDLSFHYVQQNYAGNHDQAEVSSDTDKELVKIQTVH